MKKYLIYAGLLIVTGLTSASFTFDEHKTLAIGAKAPDFKLQDVDGRTYTLDSFRDARILVVVFICNHCPTSQAYEKRIVKLASDYAPKGVSVVAINPNNPASLRVDELGYSDVGDSFQEMKIRAKNEHFNFPYLYDGDMEIASNQYGPASTPHIFIFDTERKLRYQGRIDDMENPARKPVNDDARNAIDALLAGRQVTVANTKVFGCSIKWIDKKDWIQKAEVQWAKEPVSLQTVDEKGIAELLKNKSDKLRLINVWATWCVPCVQEFTDLVTINHMYRDRGFELVTISSDEPKLKGRALAFLQKKQASGPNFLYTGESKYKMIDAIDANWQGALPYTVLVEPGGKIVYAKQGAIDPDTLKKIIFNDPMIGRIYKEQKP